MSPVGAVPAGPLPVVPCVGAVIHDPAGRLLLIRRGHDPHRGLWSLPGGRIEAGESPEQAVVREVREETGLEVVPGRPVAGDDASDVMFADAAALERLSCTPRLVETLGGWGVLPR